MHFLAISSHICYADLQITWALSFSCHPPITTPLVDSVKLMWLYIFITGFSIWPDDCRLAIGMKPMVVKECNMWLAPMYIYIYIYTWLSCIRCLYWTISLNVYGIFYKDTKKACVHTHASCKETCTYQIYINTFNHVHRPSAMLSATLALITVM